jgi:hypothetical protein
MHTRGMRSGSRRLVTDEVCAFIKLGGGAILQLHHQLCNNRFSQCSRKPLYFRTLRVNTLLLTSRSGFVTVRAEPELAGVLSFRLTSASSEKYKQSAPAGGAGCPVFHGGKMKTYLFAFLVVITGMAVAQNESGMTPFAPDDPASAPKVTEKLYSVSRSDLYCSGFVSKQKISKDNFVEGGLNSPYATRFADRDLVFLTGNYQVGSRVSIIRQLRNPDSFQTYAGTDKLLAEAGEPYADIGYARVLELRNGMAIARIEFACESVVPGDQIVPFVERPKIATRESSTLELFPGEKSSVTGKIAMVRDFDQYATTGRKVYLSIGWEKGVKCGDYFSVTRSYSPGATDIADAGAFSTVLSEDTQKNPPKLSSSRFKSFPRRLVGEVIVLNVTPTSATAMVTFDLEEMHAGDTVVLENRQGESAPVSDAN